MTPLNGRNPKDIEPIIYESSKRNKCIVSEALHDDAWIGKVSLEPQIFFDEPSISIVDLWVPLEKFNLDENVSGEIS
jgi:hypothetical protein